MYFRYNMECSDKTHFSDLFKIDLSQEPISSIRSKEIDLDKFGYCFWETLKKIINKKGDIPKLRQELITDCRSIVLSLVAQKKWYEVSEIVHQYNVWEFYIPKDISQSIYDRDITKAPKGELDNLVENFCRKFNTKKRSGFHSTRESTTGNLAESCQTQHHSTRENITKLRLNPFSGNNQESTK
jgi:hypothetical protein